MALSRAYYGNSASGFLADQNSLILGKLAEKHGFDLDQAQKSAWLEQIDVLKNQLKDLPGAYLFLEYSIPRMGKRADAVILNGGHIFVVEFKVGAEHYDRSALDQVEDYALDLKNFHEGSHNLKIFPILVATAASSVNDEVDMAPNGVAHPMRSSKGELKKLIQEICTQFSVGDLSPNKWVEAGYKPTPTIIEAAKALYKNHNVSEISRSDAEARNLKETAECLSQIIEHSKRNNTKSICFLTGVPGAGKTLAGLNLATQRMQVQAGEHAVFLSGNGPLVDVLREALARDQSATQGISKKDAQRKVNSFIQNIHHFRDENLRSDTAPVEKVVIFDEAQRAWTKEQATKFMQQKKGISSFDKSEPEFLISVMDRHQDWCTIVCLIGGGQEINTGEAGVSEWINAVSAHFKNWQVHVSPQIFRDDYKCTIEEKIFLNDARVFKQEALHLSVSLRSFRAESLSSFVGHLINSRSVDARAAYAKIRNSYPIKLTRDLTAAREWTKAMARGSERFGLLASSGGARLKSHGVFVANKPDPVTWFLNDRTDIRSSFYLEEVACEFDVQGLELDWACVCWDADFRFQNGDWEHWNFKGSKWQSIKNEMRQLYLRNSYRVLLTRARQGVVIFVPYGNGADHTRESRFYDETYNYLAGLGLDIIG